MGLVDVEEALVFVLDSLLQGPVVVEDTAPAFHHAVAAGFAIIEVFHSLLFELFVLRCQPLGLLLKVILLALLDLLELVVEVNASSQLFVGTILIDLELADTRLHHLILSLLLFFHELGLELIAG